MTAKLGAIDNSRYRLAQAEFRSRKELADNYQRARSKVKQELKTFGRAAAVLKARTLGYNEWSAPMLVAQMQQQLDQEQERKSQ